MTGALILRNLDLQEGRALVSGHGMFKGGVLKTRKAGRTEMLVGFWFRNSPSDNDPCASEASMKWILKSGPLS